MDLALTSSYDLIPFTDPMTGKTDPRKRWGPGTGDAAQFRSWEEFWTAYETQTRFIIQKIVGLFERSEGVLARFSPTPYLSCLVRGCATKALDITQGGPELFYGTIEAVTYATTVDSLLAVKYLVFDSRACSMQELIDALRDNWGGHESLQAQALNKAPKYGRDDDGADDMGLKVMELWTEETWKHRSQMTDRKFRPGMLSWNYWIADSFILAASPDGRPRGKFLSNALCPPNGADIHGPSRPTQPSLSLACLWRWRMYCCAVSSWVSGESVASAAVRSEPTGSTTRCLPSRSRSTPGLPLSPSPRSNSRQHDDDRTSGHLDPES